MSLTPQQLASLRQDLIALASIEYDDLMHELLDHYANLTERKMVNGIPFSEASKWAWAELGSGEGIQQIQTDYTKSILHQVKNQHFNILKSYFRWPTILTTTLVGILMYLTVPLLPSRAIAGIVFILTFGPFILLIWGYHKSVDSRISTGKAVWQYMQQKGTLPLNLVQIGLNLPSVFFDDSSSTTRLFMQNHPNASVVICLFCLLYTTSFIQLYRHKFHYKIA